MLDRKINGPVMMPISEKYKDMGTIVVGKLESGKLTKGDTLVLMPNKVISFFYPLTVADLIPITIKEQVEVSAIYNELEDEIPSAYSGDNVRIRLRGVEDEDISPGFVLTSPSRPIHAVKQFQAQLAILDSKNIICAGYGAVMHVHTLSEEVVLAVRRKFCAPIVAGELTARTSKSLLHYFDKKTGRKSKKPPQFAKKGLQLPCFAIEHDLISLLQTKGQKIIALLEATAPICVERFDDYPQLGRFTLRDEG
jgi:peptide chain release factor subunit 3